ncbi:nitroreductase family deazaflavin-dependent oxidoreductase [Streptomyces sp. N35]|uniref:nitroreductase family deazaflavin-dependent oxidoreductase n=1 Tax=Streptomyces sp. N35 TaxID=2795730 RepID=UPI0018F710BB|nr:nitroreductase family deazaflavin-dependent oxidoreductase [Streptomyces sp. N35]
MPPGVKLMQKVSSSKLFMKVGPHFVPAMDRAVHKLTRGKVMLSAQMLPGVILTVKGAKSGIARRTPLACMPEEDNGTWVLIGSNFGRPGHPVWTVNLLKNPDAEISWKGTDIDVTARLLEGDERAAVWEKCLKFWPPYATYQQRVDREIRLFRLERRTREQ